jgi:hypothetical protein
MIYVDNSAIEAVNAGEDTPERFYNRAGELIAKSRWVSTDAWRGYTEIVPARGFIAVDDSWVTGDWSDAPAGHSNSEVNQKIQALEAKHGDLWVIYAPTSNVFSTSYAVIARNNRGGEEAK